MKYRLVELLRCPTHPDAMLRVTEASLSDVFPYSGDLQIPVCRSGCAYLGNRFDEVPESLPRQHRFDCRRCLGTEIEKARLTCPECSWSLRVEDGVLHAGAGTSDANLLGEPQIHQRVGSLIEKHLSVEPGGIALILAPLPEALLGKWCSKGIERLHVEVDPEVLQSGRAMSCANGQGMAHFVGGPLDISVLREGMLDGLVMTVPCNRISGFDESFGKAAALLRHSGKAILLYPRYAISPRFARSRFDKYVESLPRAFRDLTVRMIGSQGVDLLLLSHPEPPNGNSAPTKHPNNACAS